MESIMKRIAHLQIIQQLATKKYLWKIIVFIILAITALVGLYVVAVQAEEPSEGGVAVTNTYALVTTTGANPGENILFFYVRYLDDKGTQKTKYILVSDGEMQEQYNKVRKLTGDEIKTRLTEVSNATNHTVPSSYRAPLSMTQKDTFVFTTETPVKEVLEIGHFLRIPQDNSKSTSWGAQGIRLYNVERLYGMSMAGYYSDVYNVDFKGTMIAEMQVKGNDAAVFNSDVDKLFRIKASTAGVGNYVASGVSSNIKLETRLDAQYASYDSKKTMNIL